MKLWDFMGGKGFQQAVYIFESQQPCFDHVCSFVSSSGAVETFRHDNDVLALAFRPDGLQDEERDSAFLMIRCALR